MLYAGAAKQAAKYPIRREDGRDVWIECTVNVTEEPALLAYITYRDISIKNQSELSLKEKAKKDYLTGLYNRRSCVEKLDHLLENGKQNEGRSMSLSL